MDRQSQIRELVRPSVVSMDCELWGVEYATQGRHATLRIFIEKEGGVMVDDCERVSRQVSAVLEVEDPIDSAYTLEVSSPGMDRLLFEPSHYKKYVGEAVNVRLRLNFEGRRNFKGTLSGVEDDEVILQVEEDEFVFPIEMIERAQIVPRFG